MVNSLSHEAVQALLKSDLIPHKLVPVSGYNDLERANAELVANDPEVKGKQPYSLHMLYKVFCCSY